MIVFPRRIATHVCYWLSTFDGTADITLTLRADTCEIEMGEGRELRSDIGPTIDHLIESGITNDDDRTTFVLRRNGVEVTEDTKDADPQEASVTGYVLYIDGSYYQASIETLCESTELDDTAEPYLVFQSLIDDGLLTKERLETL